MDDQLDDDLYRALLSCIAELESFVDRKEKQKSACPIMNSTRALIHLLEGWCVDHAVRFDVEAISALAEDEKNDEAILAVLRSRFHNYGESNVA